MAGCSMHCALQSKLDLPIIFVSSFVETFFRNFRFFFFIFNLCKKKFSLIFFLLLVSRLRLSQRKDDPAEGWLMLGCQIRLKTYNLRFVYLKCCFIVPSPMTGIIITYNLKPWNPNRVMPRFCPRENLIISNA